MKKGQLVMGIVGLAVALIIGLIVTTIVVNQVRDRTDLDTNKEEAITTSARVAYLANTPVVSIENVNNGTLAVENYTWESNGFLNITEAKQRLADNFVVNYTSEPTGYMTGTSGTVIELLPLVFAIVLFSAVAGYIAIK
jgi:inner membrane protein involved in colicin E2 resistance